MKMSGHHDVDVVTYLLFRNDGSKVQALIVTDGFKKGVWQHTIVKDISEFMDEQMKYDLADIMDFAWMVIASGCSGKCMDGD